MKQKTRLADAILDGLTETDPIDALNALCIATGTIISRVESITNKDILEDALDLIKEVKVTLDE